MAQDQTGFVNIAPLLKRLSTVESARKVAPSELAAAVALTFTNSISPVQLAVLCWALHTTGQDHQPEVLAACASAMRSAAPKVDPKALEAVIQKKAKGAGDYHGGLVSHVHQW